MFKIRCRILGEGYKIVECKDEATLTETFNEYRSKYGNRFMVIEFLDHEDKPINENLYESLGIRK